MRTKEEITEEAESLIEECEKLKLIIDTTNEIISSKIQKIHSLKEEISNMATR